MDQFPVALGRAQIKGATRLDDVLRELRQLGQDSAPTTHRAIAERFILSGNRQVIGVS